MAAAAREHADLPRPDSAAPIGVFDSGVGGLSILRAMRSLMPHEHFVYVADSANAPYGERGEAFVSERSLAIARELVHAHAIKLLVVACNTATAAAIHLLRGTWPGLPIVGVEPAIKPAVQLTRTGRVGVLATRGTLASAKFRALRESLPGAIELQLQACDGLAAAIEAGDQPAVQSLCARYVDALGPLGTAPGHIDTVVLGCTHYPFAQPLIDRLQGAQIRIVETGEPVARQVQRVLEREGLLAGGPGRGALTLIGPGAQQSLDAAAGRWIPASN